MFVSSARTLLTFVFASLLLLGLSACAEDDSDNDPATTAECGDAQSNCAPETVLPEGDILSSAKQRLAPTSDTAVIDAQVEGNTAFALDMYTILSEQDGNLIFSPHSISIALAMTYAGAQDTTADEMQSTLHFTGPDDTHTAFNALDQALASRGQNAANGTEGTPFKLSVANSLWTQRNFPFRADYLDKLALHYGAPVYQMDFVNDFESARETINAWVGDKTEDRIPDLLGPGTLSPVTRLVLTNAVYFKADWAVPFIPEATAQKDFNTLAGTTIQTDMMYQEATFPYAEGEGYKALEMPYVGDELSMVFILPTAGTFADFQAQLSPTQLRAITDSLQSTLVRVEIPKFDFESKAKLKDHFKTLGMTKAFEGDANFTGMFDPSQTDENLYVSAIIHQANITLDEKGTEASAATAVVVAGTTSVGPEPSFFNANSPFLFMIRDKATNSIIFLGHIVDPS